MKNINLKFKTPLFIILSACFFAFNTNHAFAQSIDLGIYPPIFQVQTVPPADVKVPFTIQNFSDTSVNLNIGLRPFTASDTEDGQVLFLDSLDSYPDPQIFDQVRVLDNNDQINSITLSPKQKRNLNLELFIPQGEQKGDYYFSLIFKSLEQNQPNTNITQSTGGISTNVLLTVGPIGKAQGIIENFSAPLLVNQGPVPFTVRVKNTSDHFVTPTGNILITNMYGQNVGKIDLLPVNILSNTVRRIPDSLQSPNVSDKNYQKIKSVVENNKFPVAVWPEKFLFGPYTATLTLALSDQGPLYVKTITFFAFPTEYLIGIVIILAIITFIILRVRKKIN